MENLNLICVGNAIVDVIVDVKDEFLIENNLKKGSMIITSNEVFNNLFSKINNYSIKSGGSAANTAVGFSSFGGKSLFIGRTGKDDFGKAFSNDLQKSKVEFYNDEIISLNSETSKCLILVSDDGERTMCTNLDASNFLLFKNFDYSILKKDDFFYIEGYLFDLDETKNSIIELCKHAKDRNLNLCLSLSDSFCVNRHRDDFIFLIKNYINVLFANEAELDSLCKFKNNLTKSHNFLKDLVQQSVITYGSKGSKIFLKEKIIQINPVKTSKVVDTTGAGDLYASGFLYGLSKRFSLVSCGLLAGKAATQIIQHYGARPEKDLSKLI